MKKEELKEKWWYRFLQVIFFVLCTTIIIISATFAWDDKPEKVVDQDKSTFTCISGNSNRVNESYGFEGKGFLILEDGSMLSYQEDEVKKWCSNSSFIPNAKNYKMNLVFKSDGSWITFIRNIVITFLITVAVLLAIRKAFLYVLIGSEKK